MASDQIDFIIADLEDYTQGEIVRLAQNVDANLRSSPPVGTPVDIGWARANWIPSIGEPIILGDVKDPKIADIGGRASRQQQGVNELLAYRLADGPLFNSNSVAYINRLNEGHSPQQAQPGFVQRALELAVKQTEASAVNKRVRGVRAASVRAAKPRPKK